MIRFEINNEPDQMFSTVLNGRRVSIRLRFNPVIDRWSFDLSIDGEPVLYARRIVTGIDLLAAFDFGIGVIFALGDNVKTQPGRDALPNGTVKLYHASDEELNAAVS